MFAVAQPINNLTQTKQHGFTLIEILITMLIIGIVASFAVLATGDFGHSQRIEAAAEELDLLIGLAQQQAILQPAVFGLSVDNRGYRFYQYRLDKEGVRGRWQAIERDNVLHYHSFPKKTNVSLTLIRDQKTDEQQPAIILSPSGNMTSFTIELGKMNAAPLFRITGKASGELTLVELE